MLKSEIPEAGAIMEKDAVMTDAFPSVPSASLAPETSVDAPVVKEEQLKEGNLVDGHEALAQATRYKNLK